MQNLVSLLPRGTKAGSSTKGRVAVPRGCLRLSRAQDTRCLVGTLDDGLEAILNGHRVRASHVRCYSVEEHRPHLGLSVRGLIRIPRRDEEAWPCRPLFPVEEAGQRHLQGETSLP